MPAAPLHFRPAYRRAALALAALCAALGIARPGAADWAGVLDAARRLRPPGAPGEAAVLDALEARGRERLEAIEHPSAKGAWEARLRARLRQALGLDLLPEPRPRGVRGAGSLDRGGCRLEKLVFESLPGVEVPAHLYLPKERAERVPAVLFVPGHWYAESKAKADFQAFCLALAQRGVAVLSYDPIGQGERGVSLRDHRRTELLALGIAQEAIVVFESLCALEILRSRAEVDGARLGVTGASGGGFNTWMLAALDPSLASAAPVVGTSEFLEQAQAVRERDWYDAKEHCHFVPGLWRFANNHELLALAAPVPLLVIAAHNDHSFRIPGNRQVAEYGRRFYAAIGKADAFAYFEDEAEGHGYQKAKREAACGWLLRWLRQEGGGGPAPEPPLEVLPPDAPELRCFPPGENRAAGPGLVAFARSVLEGLKPAPIARGRLEPALNDLLGFPLPPRLTSTGAIERGSAMEIDAGAPAAPLSIRIERVGWAMRDGVEVPALLLKPKAPRGAVLAAGDAGKEALLESDAIRAALAAGFAVALADPRGAGELAVSKPGWTYAVSLLLGESFPGRAALDLAAGVRALASMPELRRRPIALLGSGPFAALAAVGAAAIDPRVDALICEGGFASFRSFVERPRSHPESFRLSPPGEEKASGPDREIPPWLVPAGALRRFDLPDLFAALSPRPVLLRSAIDGDFEVLPGREVSALLARGREAERTRNVQVDAAIEPFLRALPEEAQPARPLGAHPASVIDAGQLPSRVHAVEDFETDIERRWWMSGRLETANVPAGSRRACRATLAKDFDDLQGDPREVYAAVIFNPVPGPPMGPNTRLRLRYWIRGADAMRVQIYSLSNGYHRHLSLAGLPQAVWSEATVDLTAARRPDGSGGPLSADERIDDIQFYVDPKVELLIDDIALYDAAPAAERAPFPRRIVFCGWFDTGRQGAEWPGDFEIVPHEAPRTWKAARSVPRPGQESGWIRLSLRGERPFDGKLRLRLRYRLRGAEAMRIEAPLRDGALRALDLARLESGEWSALDLDLASGPGALGELRFLLAEPAASLEIDDVVLYEP